MRKLAVITWLLAIAVAAVGLFHISYRVQGLERELGEEHRLILEHREAIHVLNAEWSYLNRPGRIAELATRHLGLAPMSAQQVVFFDELPPRRTAGNETGLQPGAATPASARSAQ